MVRSKLLVGGILLMFFVSGCSSKEEKTFVFGEGPRFPDREGIATDINFNRVVIDGKHSFRITPKVQSFSTYNGSVVPLLHHKGRYVQIGLAKDKEVEWIASIGLVVTGERKTVIYNGVVEKLSAKGAVFKDGTVLMLSARVDPPKPGDRVKATIDAVKHQVIELTPQ